MFMLFTVIFRHLQFSSFQCCLHYKQLHLIYIYKFHTISYIYIYIYTCLIALDIRSNTLRFMFFNKTRNTHFCIWIIKVITTATVFILTMHSYKDKMKFHELPSTPKNITFLPVLPPLRWGKIHIYQI